MYNIFLEFLATKHSLKTMSYVLFNKVFNFLLFYKWRLHLNRQLSLAIGAVLNSSGQQLFNHISHQSNYSNPSSPSISQLQHSFGSILLRRIHPKKQYPTAAPETMAKQSHKLNSITINISMQETETWIRCRSDCRMCSLSVIKCLKRREKEESQLLQSEIMLIKKFLLQ